MADRSAEQVLREVIAASGRASVRLHGLAQVGPSGELRLHLMALDRISDKLLAAGEAGISGNAVEIAPDVRRRVSKVRGKPASA